MNRLLRVFAVFLACILFLMGAVIAEEEDETDFDSLPLSVQELLKDRTYYESALSFVFVNGETREKEESRWSKNKALRLPLRKIGNGGFTTRKAGIFSNHATMKFMT